MGKCIFNSLWTTQEPYKNWIASTANRHVARCTACQKDIILSSMGESALKKHSQTKIHERNLKLMKTTHRLFTVSNTADSSTSIQPSTSIQTMTCVQSTTIVEPPTNVQPTNISQPAATTPICSVASFVTNEGVMDAEILWVLKTVKSHYSYNSSEGNSKLFARMFPDSQIAKQFSCGATKCSYICCFGLAPYYKSLLIKDIQEQELFTILFDETLNRCTQNKQMDIQVRFWNCKESKVKTQYLTSVFIGHAKSSDISSAFHEAVEQLDLSKLLHVSMDGPNVNWKFYDLLQEEMKREHKREIICIGSCGLHIINNSFKHGASSTNWNIKLLLSSLYWLFKDSPARREDFESVSDLKKMPLKFCGHRWLENVPVLERALEIWNDIKTYVRKVENGTLPKVVNKSFRNIAEAVKDNLILMKLNFFLAVAKLLLPFLQMYQNDKPLLPFFSDDLLKLIHQLIEHFNILKSETKKDTSTARKVCQFDFDDAKCYTALEKVSIGFVGDKLIKEKTKVISDADVMNLRRDCRGFIVKLLQHLLSKSPISYSLVRYVSCIDPRKMASDPEKCVSYMKQVLLQFCQKKLVLEEDCDDLLLEFKNFLQTTVSKYTATFKNYNVITDRLDTFLGDFLLKDECNKKLWRIMKIIMICSHGQASVERGFSVNKALEIENLKEESYIAQRLIFENTNSSQTIHTTMISKEMRKFVSCSRQKYLLHLEENRKNEKLALVETNRKRKIEEVKYLKSKKAFLQADITAMENSAEELSNKAELTKNISLFIKANGLRKEIKEKNSEIQTLDEEISKKEKDVN